MIAWLRRIYEREVQRRPAWLQGTTPWWAERRGTTPVRDQHRRVK